MSKKIKLLLSVLMLILIDQAIKLYIQKYMMGKEFNLICNILGFQPYLNNKYSWINSMGNFGIGVVTHIILVILMLIAAFFAYNFIIKKLSADLLVNILFCFLFAGGLCSLIDKVFWGGSLDYVWLKGFFIFDLKDIYLSVFEVMIIILAVINYKGFRDIKMRVLWKDFKTYMSGGHLK